MNSFIEVTTTNGSKEILNINSIAKIESYKDGIRVYFTASNQVSLAYNRYIESYDTIKRLIKAAQEK